MAESETEAQYRQAFMERVALARIARGFKQWQLAEALGMAQDKYKQYEGRSLLPHHLIGRFCIVTRVDPEWLVTGRGQKPLKPLQLAEPEPEPVAKPKRSRSKRVA
jgi:transcriptional regulator with XRE-family HTH domain